MSEAENIKRFEELKPYMGETIKAIRRARGKTQKELIQIMLLMKRPMAPDLLADIENGKVLLSFGRFLLICNAFEISINDVFAAAEIIKRESELDKGGQNQ